MFGRKKRFVKVTRQVTKLNAEIQHKEKGDKVIKDIKNCETVDVIMDDNVFIDSTKLRNVK